MLALETIAPLSTAEHHGRYASWVPVFEELQTEDTCAEC